MDDTTERARAAGRMLALFHRVWDIAPDSFAILAIGGGGFTCTRGAKGAESAHRALEASRLLEEAETLARAAFGRAQSPRAHGLHIYCNVNGPLIVPSWSGPDGHVFSPVAKGIQRQDHTGNAAKLGIWAGLMGAPGSKLCAHPTGALWCPSPEAAAFLRVMGGVLGKQPHTVEAIVSAMMGQTRTIFNGQEHDTSAAHRVVSDCAAAAIATFETALPRL